MGTHTAHSAATGRCEEPAERDAPRAIFPQVLGFLKLHARVVRTLERWARALATIVGGTLRDVDIVVHGNLLLNHERDDGTQLIADRSPGQLSCLLA